MNSYQSARCLLGLPVVQLGQTSDASSLLGVIETITIDTSTMLVDGFLVGRTGTDQNQVFLPLQCIIQANERSLVIAPRFSKKPTDSHRVLGLPAWTTHPKVLVGFVHDTFLSLETGIIESFVIHQLIRTWTIPAASVEKVTPRALLIHNDTTIKLKITPFTSYP